MLKGKKKDFFVIKRNELLFKKKWFINNVISFNSYNYLKLYKRIEFIDNFDVDVFFELNKKRLPPLFFFSQFRLIYNIFYLDLICSYRGFRHANGLPTRGQRTWTNAVTAYKSNTRLRQFKLFYYKRLLGTVNSTFAAQSYLAEQFNLLWKIQWENEWKEARKKHKKLTQQKLSYGSVEVDLQALAKGEVSGYTRRGSAAKKKMYKQKKNKFTLGFDIGFSKHLAENSVLN